MIGSEQEVRIEVDDDGPGIAPERHPEVLKSFVRLESSRNRGTGGAGLGLALARAMAEAHGGAIELCNRRRGGLRVALVLPRSATPGLVPSG